ncbi:MAG: hypothetical protein HY807_00445 [Nitrospirae bacterium]|nr:hypothetical protein [Nitrospirota bacterium]
MFNDIKKNIFLILISFVMFSLIGCVTTPPPLPEDLKLIPPSSDVLPEIAAFAGVWEGKWSMNQDTVIVIEKIDNQKAYIIWSKGENGRDVGFKQENAYARFIASVLPGPILEWRDDEKQPKDPEASYQCPCKLTISMSKDKDMLTAFFEYTDTNMKLRADLMRRK